MRFILPVILFFTFSIYGYAEEEKNQLTHGMVQMTLKVGQTTQLEVAEKFGAPNITTIDGKGQEVWIFRRHATVAAAKTHTNGFVISFAAIGGAVGAGGGGGFSNSTSGFEQSSRTMTLIIKFNAQKIVSDFRSRSSSF